MAPTSLKKYASPTIPYSLTLRPAASYPAAAPTPQRLPPFFGCELLKKLRKFLNAVPPPHSHSKPAALRWDFLRGGHAYFPCKIIYAGGTSRVGGDAHFLNWWDPLCPRYIQRQPNYLPDKLIIWKQSIMNDSSTLFFDCEISCSLLLIYS